MADKKAAEAKKKLTWKQKAFITEYLKDFNATRAALRAGYKERSAHNQGFRMMKNEEVQAEIQRQLDARALTPDQIIDRLGDHALGTMAAFISVNDKTGYALDLKKAEELGVLHLIKKVKDKLVRVHHKDGDITDTHYLEVELYDAQAALEKLGKVHGLFIDRKDFTSDGEKIVVTIEAQDSED